MKHAQSFQPPHATHNPGRKRISQAFGTADDGEAFADFGFVGITQRDDGQFEAFDFYDGDVFGVVRLDQFLGFVLIAVGQFDAHGLRALDNVQIGDDGAFRRDDKTAALPYHFAFGIQRLKHDHRLPLFTRNLNGLLGRLGQNGQPTKQKRYAELHWVLHDF